MCLCHKKYFAKSDKCRKLSHRFEMSNDISCSKINFFYKNILDIYIYYNDLIFLEVFMKRFLFILFLVLTVFVGVVAQESKSENTDEVLIKINVPETDKKVKVYVSKYPNFMGKKLITEGTSESYVDTHISTSVLVSLHFNH